MRYEEKITQDKLFKICVRAVVSNKDRNRNFLLRLLVELIKLYERKYIEDIMEQSKNMVKFVEYTGLSREFINEIDIYDLAELTVRTCFDSIFLYAMEVGVNEGF